jgi:PAS domain S-box-containing protein
MKILIVDDDTGSQNILRQTFMTAAFETVVASDGLEALQKMEEVLPDLIISDILMPRMDGFELCRRCKADQRYSRIPFLFLTATYLDARDEKLARDIGVARYLAKPMMPEDLLRIVREVLSAPPDVSGGDREAQPLSEQTYLRLHAEVVSRKLEQKIAELEHVNQELERDIAARKRTERALRNSEHRFRTLTIHAPVGIYETDAQGNCTFVNRQWCDLSGTSPAETLGRRWAQSVHPADRESIAATWPGDALAGGHWKMDYRFVTPAGKITWVQGAAVALRDEIGRVVGFLGTGLDITERKKAEGTLSESENILRALINANPEGVVLLDEAGTVLTCNETIARRLGKRADAIVGSCLWDHFPPDVAALRKMHLERVFRTGSPAQGVDTRAGRIIEHHANPVIDADGNVVACAVTSFDITDRRRIEAEREGLIADLQQALAKVKTLSGLLPICASCKKIRDDNGYWTQIESYIRGHSEAEFTHGLCPDCAEKCYREAGITRE